MRSLLLLIPLCASSLLLLTATTNADNLTFYMHSNCPAENLNYTGGSAFQANLDAILSSLPAAAAAASSGFAENVSGAAPNKAYGVAQCRGDISASDCRACLNDAAHEVAGKCQGQKSAELLYEGCRLRYSNTNFSGELDTSTPWYMCDPDSNATQPQQFNTLLGELMSNLSEQAYGSRRMFAADSIKYTPFETIYGMVQCTRDLSPDDCHYCLVNAVGKIQTFQNCSGKQTVRIFNWSCSIRFELTPFFSAEADDIPGPATSINPAGRVSRSTGTGSSPGAAGISITALVSIPVAITLLLLLLVAVYICNKRRKSNKLQIEGDGHRDDEEMKISDPLQYDLSTLRAATNNFSEENKLGRGGFGPVYKGTMQNGQEIAVKRLSTISQQGLVEMKNEIVLVAKLQHRNLVRLLGFCIEEEEKLLVYEFLSNKSLNKVLFDPAREQKLSWGQRYKIIKGISRGLLYLHEDSRLTIIHRDLKPGNILLDSDMNPKISDFGLAKLFKIESSVANTRHIAGTYGYMAPEYASRGIFSTKSDVFSYGVLVLEIVTGRPASEDLLSLVWRHWSLGSVTQLLEEYPVDEPGKQDMLRCIHIGLLCVQEDPQLRPRMASVLLLLENRIVTMSAPTKPAFVIPGPGEGPMAAAPEPSINEASVSDLEPR